MKLIFDNRFEKTIRFDKTIRSRANIPAKFSGTVEYNNGSYEYYDDGIKHFERRKDGTEINYRANDQCTACSVYGQVRKWMGYCLWLCPTCIKERQPNV